MNLRTRAAGVLAAGALLAAGTALAAGATTDACQAQFGAQCGTFAGHDVAPAPPGGHPVFWDVKHGSTATGAPVIGYGANSAMDKATDWVKVEHRGIVPGLGASNGSTISYSFVFTPGGAWTSKCAADTGSHTITLRPCNGRQWQRFIAQPAAPGGPVVAFTGAGSNTATNGVRIRNASNVTGFALLNVAYRLYPQDTSPGAPSTPPEGADTRILADAAPGTGVNHALFTGSQVWAWTA